MDNNTKIIALTASTEFANKVAEILDINVMPSKVITFADGEVMFEGGESFRGCNVYIVQSTCYPVTQHLMELLVAIDACKRGSAKSITCIMPYFGYARQDRKAKPRQPITARLVADLLTTAGANRIVCTDLHASQIQGFFNIPVDEVVSTPLYYHYFINEMKLNKDDIVCVSPDHGGVVRTSRLAEKIGAPIAIIDKRRPRPNEAEIIGIVGEVEGKDCIIVDDIVDTAGTLCLAANKLKQLGARHVYACISHAILSGPAKERIENSGIDRLVITDTIPLPEEKQSEKIVVVSLTQMYADIIQALEEGGSLGAVFQNFFDEHYKEKKNRKKEQ